MGSVSDQELLDLWRGGDLTAGEELFERHYDLVYRFFSREVTSDVAPLVQETFKACLEGRRPMDPKASFRAYLLGIAYGMLESHLQKATRTQGAISDDESTEPDLRLDVVPVEIFDGSADTAPDLPAEQSGVQRRALRGLPFSDRVLIELHDFESLPEEDIASIIGVPSSAVAVRLRYARVILQRFLERAERFPSDARSVSGPLEIRETGHLILRNAVESATERRLSADTYSVPPFDLPDASPPRVQVEIVLDGDIEQLGPRAFRQISHELQKKVRGHELFVKRLRSGSIIVELDASAEAVVMLEKLFKSGDLKSLGGLPILAIRRVHAEPPAAAGTASAEAALADFLVSAFAADELRRFVHGFSDSARLDAALPGAPVSLSHLAFEVVRVLDRHGLVCPALFERLEAERPGRRDEIHRLRQAFEHAANAAPDRQPP